MFFTIIAVAVGAGCVVAAHQRWRRIAAEQEPSLPPTGGPREWQTESGSSKALVEALLAAPSRAHVVAELNDQLREADYELGRDRDVARTSARVALLVGTLAAVMEFTVSPTLQGMLPALVAFAGGLVGAGASARLGRRADSRAAELRSAWNRVARRVERWMDSELGGSFDQAVDRNPQQR